MSEQPAGFRSATAAAGDFAPKMTGREPRFGTGGRQQSGRPEEWGAGLIPGAPATEAAVGDEPAGDEQTSPPQLPPEVADESSTAGETELEFLRKRVKELEIELARAKAVEPTDDGQRQPRRIDPADGAPRTLAEFKEKYNGGTDEWENAEPEHSENSGTDLQQTESPSVNEQATTLRSERRIDTDGAAKNYEEFLEIYGGSAEWGEAEPAVEEQQGPERRIDTDGAAKTYEEFLEIYGGSAEWGEAEPATTEDIDLWDSAEEVEEEEPERRYDPADGTVKTKAEFLQAYNNSEEEWETASPEMRIDPTDDEPKTRAQFEQAYPGTEIYNLVGQI
eukprot:SAG31_NODE_522_length_14623_cov_6.071674_6_plen_335_part_00